MKIFALLAVVKSEETDTLLQSNRVQKNQQGSDEAILPKERTGAGTVVPCLGFVGKDEVIEDCTNQDFYEWKGEVYGKWKKPSYPQGQRDVEDDNWKTYAVNETAGWQTLCVAYAKTNGKTCQEWCAAQSTETEQLVCYKGMDDAHWQVRKLSWWLKKKKFPPTQCTLSTEASKLTKKPITGEPIDQGENGCLARWNTQICGCAKIRHDKPKKLCEWKKSGKKLPPKASEDCSYGDYHIWSGAEDSYTDPSYPPTVYGSDDLWTTKEDISRSHFAGACVAYVHTERQTCRQWCAKENMECVGGIDDAHHQVDPLNAWQAKRKFKATKCTMFPFTNIQRGVSSKWVNQEANGCDQKWRTQICACK